MTDTLRVLESQVCDHIFNQNQQPYFFQDIQKVQIQHLFHQEVDNGL